VIAQLLPSYWLVQASQVALGGRGWDGLGWAVMISWTIVLSLLAARAFKRDTQRA
jgi:ABC-2 type transport system permease protein